VEIFIKEKITKINSKNLEIKFILLSNNLKTEYHNIDEDIIPK
jgi:hypothetical protein